MALGLGSQRAALEDRRWEASFQVRRLAPSILLLANLGAVQLNYGYGLDECRRAVEMVDADALVLHLNPLQEAVEPDGDARLRRPAATRSRPSAAAWVCRSSSRKWAGVSRPATARRLVEAGVAVIDVAGAGGTSWSQVAMHRARTPEQAELAAAFADWGIPTADGRCRLFGARLRTCR